MKLLRSNSVPAMASSPSQSSKTELQAELKQPRLIAGRGHLPSGGQIDARARSIEARRVGKVVDLRAEIEALGLRHFDLLEERRVQLNQPVIAQDVAAGIAIRVLRREEKRIRLIRQQSLAGRVRRYEEPAVHVAQNHRGGDGVGVLRDGRIGAIDADARR